MKKFLSIVPLILYYLLSACGTSMPDEELSLSTLISSDSDILSVTINGFGETTTLQNSDLTDFLDVFSDIQYTVAPDGEDITTPGAIALTISINYVDGQNQTITLPFFLHDDILYVTANTSVQLLAPFHTGE